MLAPLALTQLALPHIPDGGTIINVTSDAGIEAYDGWGGYGSSKAAFEQWTAILGVERPHLRIYAVDPGDMRTQMHQEAFPGEDISDRAAARGERPRAPRAARRRPAERALPRPRPRARVDA